MESARPRPRPDRPVVPVADGGLVGVDPGDHSADPLPHAPPAVERSGTSAADGGAPDDGAPDGNETGGVAAESGAQSGEPAPVVALSVAGAARGLGVAPGTLRSWERRYGLVPSAHTVGGHRRYGPVDLARLGVMHRLVQEGVPPAEAARAAIAAPIRSEDVDATNPYVTLIGVGGSDVGVRDVGAREAPEALNQRPGSPGSTSGGGRVLSVPNQPRAVRGLARSAMALDSWACQRAIAAALGQYGVLTTWDQLVRPVLAAIGDRWEQTNRGVEIEHSFSMVLLSALATHAAHLERPLNGRPAVLASAADELHDLPLIALQAALSDVGIRSHVIGARTPAQALSDAVARLGPPVVFLWAQMPGPRAPQLPVLRPAPALIVGGPGWSDIPAGAQRVDDLGEAVGAVRLAMGL